MKTDIHRQRRDLLSTELAGSGVAAAVLTRPHDCYYYTGYTGQDAVVVMACRSGRTWLITDPRYREEAARTAPGAEVVMWKGGMGREVGLLLRKLRLKRVGVTTGHMTVAFHTGMTGAAPSVQSVEEIGNIIGRQRAIKSAGEIKAMRTALHCAETSFLSAKKRWKRGMTEMDVRNDLEWEMRRNGAIDTAFETIVAAGPNASLPHAHAGMRKLAAGKMLLIDFGARVGHYNSDLTRTLWFGSIPKTWEKRYNAVLAAQLAAIQAIRPGATGREVHMVAVAMLREAGVAEAFTHGLGHGVGLAVHEEPRLSPLWNEPLLPGHIVTVEPGVYFPGAGGIRTEDMVLVTASGHEVMSSLGKELRDVVL